MAGLNMGIISALPVRLPPLDQQASIVERFANLQTDCDQLADIQTRKLAALDELKRSLLHQAFSGGLSRRWAIAWDLCTHLPKYEPWAFLPGRTSHEDPRYRNPQRRHP